MSTGDNHSGMRQRRIDAAKHLEGTVAAQWLIDKQRVFKAETAAGFTA
jgi:hypothetical protein